MSTPAPNQPAPNTPKTAEELRKEEDERLRKEAEEAYLRKRLIILGIMYVILPLLLIYLLFAVFPPYPWPADPTKDDEAKAVVEEAKAKTAEARATAAETRAIIAETAANAPPAGASPATSRQTATEARTNADTLRQAATLARDTAEDAKVRAAIPKKLQGNTPIYFFGGRRKIDTSLEERLLLLVIIMGALGSYIHAATSFADYTGNRQFAKSWTAWYILRPFIGIGLALVIYTAVRGGLLSMVMSGAVEAGDINPFGVAALAGLTGMFSKQAGDKLNEVFSTLFKSTADDNRKDGLTPAPAPEVKNVDPKKGATAGGTNVTITGTGFVDKAKVLFGGQEATKVEVDKNTTTIKAVTPASKKAGPVDVEVINEDGKKGTLKDGYTYDGNDAEEGADGKKKQDSLTPAPALDVKDIDPKEGSTAGGTNVTITGTGFVEKAKVTFGGVDAKDVKVVDTTTIKAVTPPHEAGPVDVEVTNGDGKKDALKKGYTYKDGDNGDNNGAEGDASNTVEQGSDEEDNAAHIASEEALTDEGDDSEDVNGATQSPTIDSIEPNSGPLTGMEKIEIVGTNFSEGASVKIGGKSATVGASIPTSITVLTPPGDEEGPVDVVITNTDGLNVTETDGYTYTA